MTCGPPEYLVLCSGGIDSTVLLARLTKQGRPVIALHLREPTGELHEIAARASAEKLGVRCLSINLTDYVLACMDRELGGGSAGRRLRFGSGAFYALALALASAHGIPRVAVGLTAEDQRYGPEHTAQFLLSLEECATLAGSICALSAPFVAKSKAEVVQEGVSLGLDLASTWSCNTPVDESHDGTCTSCRERQRAFRVAGVPDYTRYAVVTQ